MSWKVRRAAAKCIDAVVVTRPDLLEALYKKVVPDIIARFKERYEHNINSNNELNLFAQHTLRSQRGEREVGHLQSLHRCP